ncbi:MAG: metallophosphoesterase family protein [Desulfosarcina sp.]|nr:metallophosphoesterase family protein [Desulfobacterales bacterium]
MRIYAAADLHGHRARFEIVARHAERADVQAVVIAGDMVNYCWGHDILVKLAALPKPVYVVRGNTDPVRIEHTLAQSRRVHSLHLKRVHCHGLQLTGISGTLPIPFRSRIGWSEAKHLKRLAAMIGPQSVLVAHPPPWGIRDRVGGRWRAGCRSLRRLIETASPAVVICGHIHEAAGIAWLGRTLVVNCALGKQGQGAIINYDGHTTPSAQML